METGIKKISEIESPTEEDLQHALEILEEAFKIGENKELLKNVSEYGKKKAETYSSIAELREKANEMALNPGEYAGMQDEFAQKKAKRLEKKA